MATLPDILARHATTQPDAVALQTPDRSMSYSELWDAANGLAQALRDSGFTRFGLVGDNTLAWVLADLACRLAGVVCVPVPGFFSRAQVDHLVARAGLEALLLPQACAEARYRLDEQVALQPLPATPGALAMPAGTGKITFTSGSTGTPKGVCLSHQQLDATVAALAERLQGVNLRRHLCVLPLATLLENIAGVYLPLTLGATVMVWPLAELGFSGSSGLELARLVEALNTTRPDSLILVPELATALVSAVELGLLDAGSFRFLAVGGARVSPTLLQRARALGLPLYEGYGLSECGSVVALNVPGCERAGTVGKPLGHVGITVSEDGEILVSGNTFLGYLGDRAATSPQLATGDLGNFDADGFLQVSGRRKNLLITSYGRNISPEWLESELQQRLGIRQALVFGDGEPNPSALLVVTDARQPAQLQEAVRQLNRTLPDYARLHTIYLRRAPFTQAEGYLTANGRPVRAKLMNDLSRLLASADFAALSERPRQSPAACLETPVN
ncbi:AMP-binding protein [Marinobacter mobilis]|uniref:Long-chain acyl-CoA synthetase (AMP-forming) n=1 Tax=Marinobacter mobilis TaxID=488533 RepID=A0A1H2Y4U7_9GAMM|nr:AMP-binding protein [Marinobacter mobilis]SDX00147.1 Long-chain acyl-CoA synthetase (AMP-forming) [Marinobacter mobilis]